MNNSHYNEFKSKLTDEDYLISRKSLGTDELSAAGIVEKDEGQMEYIDMVRQKNESRNTFEEELGHYSQVTEFGFDIKEQ